MGRIKKPAATLSQLNLQGFWWLESKENVAGSVRRLYSALSSDASGRISKHERHAALYEGREVGKLRGNLTSRGLTPENLGMRQGADWNVVASCVDTVVSKITLSRPMPEFAVTAGDYSLRRKAMKMEKFVKGQLDAMDFQETATDAVRDACVFGTGIIKIFEEDGDIRCERVLPDEIFWNEAETEGSSKPRTMLQLKLVSRALLMSLFPESKADLEKQQIISDISGPKGLAAEVRSKAGTDMVEVVESWHLPSTSESADGRHVMVAGDVLLLEEPWTRKDFPFLFINFVNPVSGFFGKGIAGKLARSQASINWLLERIERLVWLLGVPKVFVDRNSGVNKVHLAGKIGTVVEHNGRAPTIQAGQVVSSDTFGHLDRIFNRCFEVVGISALSAASLKPPGVDANVALLTLLDNEARRFTPFVRRWERMFVKAADQILELAKELSSGKRKGFKVRTRTGAFTEEIDFKDIDLKRDMYQISVTPVSDLGATPQGRLQLVQNIVNTPQLLQNPKLLALINVPDLQSFNDLETASTENIDWVIEKALSDGRLIPPDPLQDLGIGMERVKAAYNRAMSEEAPEERLDVLRQWMVLANEILNPAPPVQPAAGVQKVETYAAQPVAATAIPTMPQAAVQ